MLLVVLVLRGIAEVMTLVEDGRDVAAIRFVQTPEGDAATAFYFGNGFEYFRFALDTARRFILLFVANFPANVVVEQVCQPLRNDDADLNNGLPLLTLYGLGLYGGTVLALRARCSGRAYWLFAGIRRG